MTQKKKKKKNMIAQVAQAIQSTFKCFSKREQKTNTNYTIHLQCSLPSSLFLLRTVQRPKHGRTDSIESHECQRFAFTELEIYIDWLDSSWIPENKCTSSKCIWLRRRPSTNGQNESSESLAAKVAFASTLAKYF